MADRLQFKRQEAYPTDRNQGQLVNSPVKSEMAMFTIRGVGVAPNISTAAKLLDVAPEDVDSDFGVVLVDPAESVYCVMANKQKVKPTFGDQCRYEGPWAAPEIRPI